MSSTTWWILAGTIPIALIIMITAFVVMKIKVEKIKNNYLPNNLDANEIEKNKALEKEDNGDLVWHLKQKFKNPLSDKSMSFAINTMLRNNYKTFQAFDFEKNYEAESLKIKTNAKKINKDYEFALVNFNNNTIDKIDNIIKLSTPKSLIMIVNVNDNKIKKEMLKYLKLIRIRNEFQKIDKGIILIAK